MVFAGVVFVKPYINMSIENSVLFSSYFPSISYINILAKSSSVTIDMGENYLKQTYRNRCEIFSANGPFSLSVPIEKKVNPHTPTKEIKIASHTLWQKNHLRAIESAYRSSPFFQFYFDDFAFVFENQFQFLIDLNSEILNGLIKTLGLKTSISYSTVYIENSQKFNDYRKNSNYRNQIEKIPCQKYYQVFDNKFGFVPNLSILDLLFNLGPETKQYLLS